MHQIDVLIDLVLVRPYDFFKSLKIIFISNQKFLMGFGVRLKSIVDR